MKFATLKVAISALAANKLRTSLTLLGMIIGVASVTALMSIGRGVEQQITTELQAAGTNVLFIFSGRPGGSDSEYPIVPLTYEDALALEELKWDGTVVEIAAEGSSRGMAVVVQGRDTQASVRGVTATYTSVNNYELAYGEPLSESDLNSRALVAVLGSNVAADLFPIDDPIDQTIRADNLRLRVIGVLEEQGSGAFGQSADDMVLIPITTAHARLSRFVTARGGQPINTISVELPDEQEETIDAGAAGIRQILRERHEIPEEEDDDFFIMSPKDLIEAVSAALGVFTLFLGAIAGISLLVGGIGIMNIMLVSVTERTREIGIRKAVGAKRRDILIQFLVESVVVSVLGGLLGITLGTLISFGIAQIPLGDDGEGLQTAVTWDIVLLAVSVAASVGIFFGIYPANRAARLDPIQALRYE